MDINQLVRESYKNTATGYVDDRSREPEPDYSARQVEALEKIAENTLHRVNAAEHALSTCIKSKLPMPKRKRKPPLAAAGFRSSFLSLLSQDL